MSRSEIAIVVGLFLGVFALSFLTSCLIDWLL